MPSFANAPSSHATVASVTAVIAERYDIVRARCDAKRVIGTSTLRCSEPRWRRRCHTRMHIEASGKRGKRALDAPINVVPYIDMLMTIMTFLVITATWTQMKALESQS